MAILEHTNWDIRTTGAATNGSGFIDSNPGTSVDYSQQDAAQLSLTDLASDGSGTGISSVTGGFTAAMEGNCMYIAGSGWTTGWYQITAYTDPNTITIDRNAGASQTGGTGNVGGAWLPNQTDATAFFSTVNKGQYNTCYWKSGTYTGTWSGQWTVSASYCRWRGYDTTHGDRPILDDRPFIEFGNTGGNLYWSGIGGRSDNMRINSSYTSGSNDGVIIGGSYHIQSNCKCTRSGYNGAAAINFSSYEAQIYMSEYISGIGTAVKFADPGFSMSFCYIHDSKAGVAYTSTSASNCSFDTCIFANITDVGLAPYAGVKANNCVFYVCGVAIRFQSTYCTITNSIFHSNTTALYSGYEYNLSDNNYYYNNGTDFDNQAVAGLQDVLGVDPLLADPANGDFTLAAGSPCFNAGWKLGPEVGLA